MSLQSMEVHDILIIAKSQPGARTYRVSERRGEPLMPRNPVLYKRWLDEPDDPHPLGMPMFPPRTSENNPPGGGVPLYLGGQSPSAVGIAKKWDRPRESSMETMPGKKSGC